MSEALKNIEYLLNNMKQAIFTIDENGTIMGPVSAFSREIFEEDIEGNINDTPLDHMTMNIKLFQHLILI